MMWQVVAREIFPQAFERTSCQKLDFVLGEYSTIEGSRRDFFPEFLFFLELRSCFLESSKR